MKVLNGDYEELEKCLDGKNVVLWGAGTMLFEMEIELPELIKKNSNLQIVDANKEKWGKYLYIYERQVMIEPPDMVFKEICADSVILITASAFEDILHNLKKYCDKEITVLCFPLVRLLDRDKKKLFIDESKNNIADNKERIPRKIHYFWVGDNNIPEHLKRNIESWHRYCPDYEIILWNEENLNIKECKYAYQAYKSKKFGFVPDYFRLKVIYEHGGIFLDTDVEVLRPLDDLLSYDAYAGFEDCDYVAFGVGFGARKGLPILKEMYEDYHQRSFILPDGRLNLIASPVYQTDVLKKYGLAANGRKQTVGGMTILPMNYLTAQSVRTGLQYCNENTYSIHHYEAGWLSKEELIKKQAVMEWVTRLKEGEYEI